MANMKELRGLIPPINENRVTDLPDGEAQPEGDLLGYIEDEDTKAAIIEHRKERRGRPRKDAAEKRAHAKEWNTFCAVGRVEYIDKLREIAHKEGLALKDVLDAIFGKAIKQYERKHGEIVLPNTGTDAKDLF